MIALANSTGTGNVDLIVKGFEGGLARGWFYNRTNGLFQSDRLAEKETPAALRAFAAVGSEQTYTVVPLGSGWRMGIDEDAGGYLDRDALDHGVNPNDPLSLAANPPQFGTITNQVALNNLPFTLIIPAANAGIPGRTLAFSLTNSPPGGTINPTTGVFTWTPADPAGTYAHNVTVAVTDNGNPPESATTTFAITVTDLNLSAGKPVISTKGITINWNAIPGLTYQVQYKTHLTDPTWIALPGTITASNNVAFVLDSPAATNVSRFYRIIALP